MFFVQDGLFVWCIMVFVCCLFGWVVLQVFVAWVVCCLFVLCSLPVVVLLFCLLLCLFGLFAALPACVFHCFVLCLFGFRGQLCIWLVVCMVVFVDLVGMVVYDIDIWCYIYWR